MKKILFLLLVCQIGYAQKKDYPIMCFEGSNSSYFFIIKNKGFYYYNFSNHVVSDSGFKELFWKKSSTLPFDTSALKMIGNTKIYEDQLSEKMQKELNK